MSRSAVVIALSIVPVLAALLVLRETTRRVDVGFDPDAPLGWFRWRRLDRAATEAVVHLRRRERTKTAVLELGGEPVRFPGAAGHRHAAEADDLASVTVAGIGFGVEGGAPFAAGRTRGRAAAFAGWRRRGGARGRSCCSRGAPPPSRGCRGADASRGSNRPGQDASCPRRWSTCPRAAPRKARRTPRASSAWTGRRSPAAPGRGAPPRARPRTAACAPTGRAG